MWHGGLILPPHIQRRYDELVTRAQRATDVAGVFEAVSPRLRQIVAFDAAVWMATDPATGLCRAPMWFDNARRNPQGIEDEFLVDDVNKFHDLARAEVPVGALRAATGGRPGRSSRYRRRLRPDAFNDELRAVLRVGRGHWGSVILLRGDGLPPFSEADVAVLAALSEPLGRALRACARIDARRWVATDVGAGLLLFGAGGELSSINDEALHWLGELPDTRLPDPARPHEIELPPSVAGVVLRARGAFPDGDGAGAWGRVQSRSGRWLVCHASALRDAGGGVTGTALVIGPARTTDLAPIIVEAHELTAREQEIASLIARGVSTAEIAGRLYLSTHTVRDHIKATFEKLDVSSRGELVAKLFAEPHGRAPAAAS